MKVLGTLTPKCPGENPGTLYLPEKYSSDKECVFISRASGLVCLHCNVDVQWCVCTQPVYILSMYTYIHAMVSHRFIISFVKLECSFDSFN